MAKNKITRTKHIPQRTCVGCRLVNAKKALTRVVRTDTGIQIDKSGKIPGRGAYVHDQKSCWHAALKGKLANALKTEISDENRRILEEYANNLPDSNTEKEDRVKNT